MSRCSAAKRIGVPGAPAKDTAHRANTHEDADVGTTTGAALSIRRSSAPPSRGGGGGARLVDGEREGADLHRLQRGGMRRVGDEHGGGGERELVDAAHRLPGREGSWPLQLAMLRGACREREGSVDEAEGMECSRRWRRPSAARAAR